MVCTRARPLDGRECVCVPAQDSCVRALWLEVVGVGWT